MSLTVPLVHPIEVGAEQGGLVSTGAGPDFHDGVAVVVGVTRQQQLVKLGGQRGDFRGKSCQVGLYQSDELGVRLFRQPPSLFELVLKPGQPVGESDHRGKPGVLAPERSQLLWISPHSRVGQLPGDLLRPQQSLAESGLHTYALGVAAAESV